MELIYQLVFIGTALLLVLLNGFFVNAEFSIVKVRETRIQELIQGGNRRASTVLKLIDNMDEYLSATQLGITLASLGLGWIGEPAFARLFEPALHTMGLDNPALTHTMAAGAAFILITFLHIVLGELAPKTLAIQLPERSALWTAAPLVLFYRMSYPLIWALNGTANGFLRLLGIPPTAELELTHSEEELRILLSRSSEHGIIDRNKKRLLMKVFSFAQRTARQVMVPSVEVKYLDVRKSLEENLAWARQQKHTRFPLCEGGLDRVLGVIHVKDLFWNYEMLGPDLDLKMLRRQTLFVPETKGIDSLLTEFRKSRIHMAIVVDEFGSAVGMVTLEDVLEELVGEIQDEFDLETPPIMIRESGNGTHLVNGRALVEEIEEVLELQLEDAENDTVAGHVMMVLGSTAKIGDELTLGGKFHVRVVGIRGHQITDLLLTPIAGSSDSTLAARGTPTTG